MKANKIFLGGTCNETTWRDELISLIQVDYFNPVVDDWTEECITIEDAEKATFCNVHLYVITADMLGVYSIAEAVQSSLTKGITTILHVMPDGFGKEQLKSLDATCGLVRNNGGIAYIDDELSRTARVINFGFKTTDFS
jgi:hypothetical protein